MPYILDRPLHQIVEDEVNNALRTGHPGAAHMVLKASLQFTGPLYRRARHVLNQRLANPA